MVRWLKRVLWLLLLLLVIAGSSAWWLLRGSLPTLDGELAIAGLSAPVTIQRDALGVVTIDAANETDAMRALGYVHAQERYFEMDLLRRTAAGELAELFGPIALDLDKQHRVHRMRARVSANLDGIVGDKRPQIEAYTAGVNAGLHALKVRPWPYLLLRQQPRDWRIEDSALAGYAMYFDLQDSAGTRELALWKIRQHVPPALYALIAQDGTSWDAPLQGDRHGDAVLPGRDALDLRTLPMPETPRAFVSKDAPFKGSNNFAVSGVRTRDGRAIVADDMHLGLRAPNLWFRARLRYSDARAPRSRVDVQGFTLPGLPAVIVGSNGHVAWGFTNSYIDTADWAAEIDCASQPALADCVRPRRVVERIAVAGAASVDFPVDATAWGPVMRREDGGVLLTLRWAAHLAGSMSLGITDFAHADSLRSALAFADRSAIPTQNLMLADSGGHIAWRLLGPIPARGDGCPGRGGVAMPVDRTWMADSPGAGWSDQHCVSWSLRSDASPVIVDPPSGQLSTANARVLDGDTLVAVGDGGYDLGARAQQVRNDLRAKKILGERDLLAIQLDDRAVFLQRWWQQLRTQSARARSPALTALADAANTWQGHASAESVSYRIVRGWRLAVLARIGDGLTAPAQAALGDEFEMPATTQLEGVAWPLIAQRPAHLLPRRFASWDALLEDAAVEVRDGLAARGPLGERTWGERNTARICHPLAGAIPLIGTRLLCMPPDPLPGDSNMPRVAGPAFGASERMVVSPGHEADGIIHMPGGQSGNPLSPFWGAGHDDWVHGRATPFLPGPATHTLRMTAATN